MRVSTEGSRAVTARRVSSVRFYPLAGAMSPLLLFVPLSLKRSSYLGMPEEYRAAPRAPFRIQRVLGLTAILTRIHRSPVRFRCRAQELKFTTPATSNARRGRPSDA